MIMMISYFFYYIVHGHFNGNKVENILNGFNGPSSTASRKHQVLYEVIMKLSVFISLGNHSNSLQPILYEKELNGHMMTHIKILGKYNQIFSS